MRTNVKKTIVGICMAMLAALLFCVIRTPADPELNGLAFDPETGDLVYYTDGEIDTSYNGFAELTDESGERWFYVENGKVPFTRDDIVEGEINEESSWYLIRKSEFTPSTTVAQNRNGWWYVKDGKVDFEFKGFGKNEHGWWYMEDGKVSFKLTGLFKGAANIEADAEGIDDWWYVKESKVTKAETVAQNDEGWWYVKDGRIDPTHNGVEQNEYGWWYIHEGKVDFDFKGFEKNQHGWWYLENGKVSFSVTSIIKGVANTDPNAAGQDAWWYVKGSQVTNAETVAKNEYGWWYVKDGKVDFTHNGVEQNENGWWYIHEGKLDFDFEGFERNKHGWWYLEYGQVFFDKEDIIQGKANTDPNAAGQDAWWYVKGSKVTKTDTVAQNEYGWWYVKDGKVDFTHNGVEQNEYGWWRIENGKVNFNFNGVAQNVHGWWYLKNGKVDFSFRGIAKKDSDYWYMEGGKATFTYTGPGIYGAHGFYLVNGVSAWGFSGTVTDATNYTVKDGIIQSGWVQFLGDKYYFIGAAKMATESVTVDGKPEVFRTDGKWIDTSSIDAKAAGYNSNTNYLILVDTSKKVTKIYTKVSSRWTPFKNYLCTVGDTSKGWGTIKGSFYVGYNSGGYYSTRGYSFNDSEGHTLYYWTRFCDDFLFHSMLYDYGTYNLTTTGNDLGVEQIGRAHV